MVTPVDALLNNSVTGGGFSADCTSQPVHQDSGWGGGERGSPFTGAFGPAQACSQESELERRKGDLGRCARVSRLAFKEILRGQIVLPQGIGSLLLSMTIQLVLGSGEKV